MCGCQTIRAIVELHFYLNTGTELSFLTLLINSAVQIPTIFKDLKYNIVDKTVIQKTVHSDGVFSAEVGNIVS